MLSILVLWKEARDVVRPEQVREKREEGHTLDGRTPLRQRHSDCRPLGKTGHRICVVSGK